MGLDNSISLIIRDKEKFGNIIPFIHIEPWQSNGDDSDTYDVLYWRKCWNIREVIYDKLKRLGYRIDIDCGDWNISLDTFIMILDELNKCYTPGWWRRHNDSIWDFKDVCENFRLDLLNAAKLVGFLSTKDPSSYQLIFVDSW